MEYEYEVGFAEWLEANAVGVMPAEADRALIFELFRHNCLRKRRNLMSPTVIDAERAPFEVMLNDGAEYVEYDEFVGAFERSGRHLVVAMNVRDVAVVAPQNACDLVYQLRRRFAVNAAGGHRYARCLSGGMPAMPISFFGNIYIFDLTFDWCAFVHGSHPGSAKVWRRPLERLECMEIDRDLARRLCKLRGEESSELRWPEHRFTLKPDGDE